MEQAMRNVERARALRIGAFVRAEPVKPSRTLSSYFTGKVPKPRTKAGRRVVKTAA